MYGSTIFQSSRAVGGLALLGQAAAGVVVDLLAVLAPDLELVRAFWAFMLSVSMTIGAIADDPLVDGAGQPGGPAPLRGAGDDEPRRPPACRRSFAQACTASMARTALLTIGKSSGQLSSLVSR